MCEPNETSPPDGREGGDCKRTVPWYRTSYPFMLVSSFFLGSGLLLPFLLCLIVAVVNAKTEDWYRHLWPWLLLIPSMAGGLACLLLRWVALMAADQLVI